MDRIVKEHVNIAIKSLKAIIDQYGIVPHLTIMKVESIIKELESVLE